MPSEDNDKTLMTKYGLITAANPFGQMLMPPIYGYITTRMKSIRMVSLVTGIIFIVGNVICAILSVFPEPARFGLFFLGRFLTGVASANKSPFRSYISQATYNEERTPQLSLISAAQSVGIVFGPLIQSALTAVGCVDHTGDDTYFTIDTYTLAR